MSELPEPTRLTVTDSTLLVIRLSGPMPDDQDGLNDALAALGQTTPGSVLVVDDTVTVHTQDREEAEAALSEALNDDRLEGASAGLELAQDLLRLLAEAGWALIRLDQ